MVEELVAQLEPVLGIGLALVLVPAWALVLELGWVPALVGVLGRRPSIHTTSTRSLPVALPPLDRPDNVCRVWGELVEIPCREFAS